jgi:hypothetical protein
MVKQWLSDLSKRSAAFMAQYGPIWLVTVYFLSFLHMGMIYLFLQYAQVDVAYWLRYYNFSTELVQLAESGGNVALAYALNRFVMPFRIWFALMIVPLIAPKIRLLLSFLKRTKKNE